MELKTPHDLFRLSAGDIVAKQNLYALIQYSKVAGSPHWEGEEGRINNTPQQGINWMGKLPACRAVIIKVNHGSYEDDGWIGKERNAYRYSFKARKGEISYAEKANVALINQPRYQYPILLFTEKKDSWTHEGIFSVSDIGDKHVVLQRGVGMALEQPPLQGETTYLEGGRKYVTHLMAERDRRIVKDLKASTDWLCDICNIDFAERYGVKYIEAHHKVPISTYSSSCAVQFKDFALLCPNCHRAVHIYMEKHGLEYSQIKEKLCGGMPSDTGNGRPIPGAGHTVR